MPNNVINKHSLTYSFFGLCILLSSQQNVLAQTTEPPLQINSNRHWDVLTAPTPRQQFAQAATQLANWPIDIAGIQLEAKQLQHLAKTPTKEPLVRAVREQLQRPFDVEDLLYFLDDLLLAGQKGLRGQLVYVPSGRARSAGILLHPDDIFKNQARNYGSKKTLRIDKPKEQAELNPAKDGDPLGPEWTVRFVNPSEENDIIKALEHAAPEFKQRVTSLVNQLRQQGAMVWYSSSLRYRERGYLMYGAFALSQTRSDHQSRKMANHLSKLNKQWQLNVPIAWRHPQGWQATREAARQMMETYGVVYATEKGARKSLHYEGIAVDFTALALPRTLTLRAPNGKTKRFDLSDPQHARDLSLSPNMIEWIETNFDFYKLRTDYPHWVDMRAIKARK